MSLPARHDLESPLPELLSGYWSHRTRSDYALILTGWVRWCATGEHDPIAEADPAVLEARIGELRARGYAPQHHRRRVSAVSAFSRWCVPIGEGLVATPTGH